MENITELKSKKKVKTYVFKVIVEPDEDRWFSCCPILEHRGAATWGYTKEEALKNIKDVLKITIESIIEHGEAIPEETENQMSNKLFVVITL